MMHIVLAGDSIFDNAPYVDQGDSVIEQLKQKLNPNDKATLLAVDGNVTADVANQINHLPQDTTHLFVSCGGNDALQIIGELLEPVSNVKEAMDHFTEIREAFRKRYVKMLFSCQQKVNNLIVCTVYDNVPDIDESDLTALALFNEIIIREAAQIGIPIIDLRLICDEPTDYSAISSIEPSALGAAKIVTRILKIASSPNINSDGSIIYN